MYLLIHVSSFKTNKQQKNQHIHKNISLAIRILQYIWYYKCFCDQTQQTCFGNVYFCLFFSVLQTELLKVPQIKTEGNMKENPLQLLSAVLSICPAVPSRKTLRTLLAATFENHPIYTEANQHEPSLPSPFLQKHDRNTNITQWISSSVLSKLELVV